MSESRVISFRLGELLKHRGWTGYELSKRSGLPLPTVYRLLESKEPESRIAFGTLDALCAALECQPGDLLEYVSDRRSSRVAGRG